MAVLTSPPYREDSVPQHLITLAEGLFEVVSHALLLRPPALPAMLPADAQSQSHFFDLWLTIAQIRCAAAHDAAFACFGATSVNGFGHLQPAGPVHCLISSRASKTDPYLTFKELAR